MKANAAIAVMERSSLQTCKDSDFTCRMTADEELAIFVNEVRADMAIPFWGDIQHFSQIKSSSQRWPIACGIQGCNLVLVPSDLTPSLAWSCQIASSDEAHFTVRMDTVTVKIWTADADADHAHAPKKPRTVSITLPVLVPLAASVGKKNVAFARCLVEDDRASVKQVSQSLAVIKRCLATTSVEEVASAKRGKRASAPSPGSTALASVKPEEKHIFS